MRLLSRFDSLRFYSHFDLWNLRLQCLSKCWMLRVNEVLRCETLNNFAFRDRPFSAASEHS